MIQIFKPIPGASSDVVKSYLFGLIVFRIIFELDSGAHYLYRWEMRLPFGWTIKLHKILLADGDRCMHDHPWAFWRLVLWGGYTEEYKRPGMTGVWFQEILPWRLKFCEPGFRHRVHHLTKGHSWSLIVTKARKNSWGFYTKNGFVHWKTFVHIERQKRINWCE